MCFYGANLNLIIGKENLSAERSNFNEMADVSYGFILNANQGNRTVSLILLVKKIQCIRLSASLASF